MKINGFVSGMIVGACIGSAVVVGGKTMMSNKGRRAVKHSAGKVLHTMGDIVDNIADSVCS